MNLFGATVLHRRVQFHDPAVLSRSIVIYTRYVAEGVEHYAPGEIEPYGDVLAAVAREIPWDSASEWGGNRVTDTRAPLCVVAKFLGDEEWLEYSYEQQQAALANLTVGQDEEPSQVTFSAVLSLALDPDNLGTPLGDPADRVKISDLKRRLSDEGAGGTSWQVGQTLRDMGFETRKTGGVM